MSKAKKVIILDDEPIVCQRLKPALEKAGFYVETYTESRKVLDRISETKFDVLVTDLKMRRPDGLEVMSYIRENSPGTKVIVITGFATVDTATEALKQGAVDFIAKPFKPKELLAIVERAAKDLEG